jgi:hypothetical protein
MEPNLNQERQQAHALLDMLPAGKLNAVRSLLEVMVEPLARSLALAPVEEEEITPETAAALDRAGTSPNFTTTPLASPGFPRNFSTLLIAAFCCFERSLLVAAPAAHK